MVLVILIALWAMVLLPPYLKDRRASSRSFRSVQRGISSTTGSAQRFLPLQQASTSYATSMVASPTGMRTTASSTASSGFGAGTSNVVPLRPAHLGTEQPSVAPMATGSLSNAVVAPAVTANPDTTPHIIGADDLGTDYLSPQANEASLHEAWDTAGTPGLRSPTSTSAARERRRHVLFGLGGAAFVTVLLALYSGGIMIAINLLIDIVLVGYVILLVRHRQLAAERRTKIEPIRPPVNEVAPTSIQIAPAYLLQSGTGS